MTIGLHCRLARPGRVAGVAEFLDFAKSYKKDVWICTREQIADFWIENHYPRGAGSPVVKKPAPTETSVDEPNDVPDETTAADDGAVTKPEVGYVAPTEEGVSIK